MRRRKAAIASVVGMLFILALSILLTAYFSEIYSSYSEYNAAVNAADQIILQRNQERLQASMQANEKISVSSYWGGSSLVSYIVNLSNGRVYSSCASLPMGVPSAGQISVNLNQCGVGNGQSLLIITSLGISFVVS